MTIGIASEGKLQLQSIKAGTCVKSVSHSHCSHGKVTQSPTSKGQQVTETRGLIVEDIRPAVLLFKLIILTWFRQFGFINGFDMSNLTLAILFFSSEIIKAWCYLERCGLK